MAKIVEVSYRKLFNLGNYENETLGTRVEVGENETPEEAMADAKAFIDAQAAELQAEREDERADADLVHFLLRKNQAQIHDLKQLKENLVRQVTILAKVLETHGLPVDWDPAEFEDREEGPEKIEEENGVPF
jgi:hypothetical protein